MPAREGVAGARVVEAGRGLPAVHAVTRTAVGLDELAAVRIGVAGETGRAKAEVRACGVDAALAQGLRVLQVLGLMAGVAGESRVLALERIAGVAMLEGFASLLAPPDQLRGAALVLDVAGRAFLVVGSGVEPPAGVHALLQGRVAREAPVGGDALAGVVALEAAAAPLQFRVRSRELPGGDLREGGAREKEKGAHQQDPPHRPHP